MNSPSTLLDKLSKINNENTISIFVPSVGKDVKFKSLNIKQQKDLIKTAMDGAASGATLNQELNNIIVSNSTEDIDFKIYDRYAIIVGLRAAVIGEEYKQKDQSINLLKELKQNIKKYKQRAISEPEAIQYHTIKVDLELPSIDKTTPMSAFPPCNVERTN
ncbi:MAG: hypothetical protein ACO3UU_10710 [Minisyncoccia bacterium]